MLRDLRDSLERLIDDHPSSNVAVDILLRRELDGLDLNAIDTTLIEALGDRPVVVQAALSREVEELDRDKESDQPGVPSASTSITSGTAPPEQREPENVKPALTKPPETPTTPPGDLSEDESPGSDSRQNGANRTGQNSENLEVATLLPTADAEAVNDRPEERLDPATEEGETQLGLSRQDIREIQARLTAIGIDPRGIDGITGPGTRGAIRQWQQELGLTETGYLDAPHMDSLREFSQSAYDAWKADPGNRARVEVVAITPTRMSGTLRFSARCGSGSSLPGQTFTGTMTIAYVGSGTYRGTARNSQGLRGQVSTRVTGRNVESFINWGFLFGTVRSQGRISDDARTFSGRDFNGCRVTASKA